MAAVSAIHPENYSSFRVLIIILIKRIIKRISLFGCGARSINQIKASLVSREKEMKVTPTKGNPFE